MRGDSNLFWQLLEPEHRRAQAFCRKLLGNREDGDDLYQDVLVNALERFDTLRENGAFKPWLYQIAINRFRNICRRPLWQRLGSLTVEKAENRLSADPEPAYTARRRIASAFAAISVDERVLITLFELEGWSIAELSQTLNLSESNVKVRLSRTRAKMRKALIRNLSPQKKEKFQTNVLKDSVCVAPKPAED
jgi:RNA polymerase sigma-70 factor (ECF subfamily)